MSQQSSAAGGPASGASGQWGGRRPGGDEYGDEYPDELWPDDEEKPAGAPGWPGPGQPGPGQPGGRPPGRRLRAASVVLVVAATAAAVGAGVVVAVDHAGTTPAVSSSPAGPGGQAPGHSGSSGPRIGGPGSGSGALPGGGSGSTAQIMMIGKVLAVSRTSITLGGPGRSITAAVTGSTRLSGKVSSISGIKVGDEVSAQMTRSRGRTVLVSVQDPAQAPPGVAP